MGAEQPSVSRTANGKDAPIHDVLDEVLTPRYRTLIKLQRVMPAYD
jgi:hypothetical protein